MIALQKTETFSLFSHGWNRVNIRSATPAEYDPWFVGTLELDQVRSAGLLLTQLEPPTRHLEVGVAQPVGLLAWPSDLAGDRPAVEVFAQRDQLRDVVALPAGEGDR